MVLACSDDDGSSGKTATTSDTTGTGDATSGDTSTGDATSDDTGTGDATSDDTGTGDATGDTGTGDTGTGDTAAQCWQPDAPEATDWDCDALCARFTECGTQGEECALECEMAQLYMRKDASAPIQECVLALECDDYGDSGDAYGMCIGKLVQSGDLVAPAANTAACTALAGKEKECPEASDFDFCLIIAAAFTEESLAKLGDCATVECADLGACLTAANCVVGGDGEGDDGGPGDDTGDGGPGDGGDDGPGEDCWVPDAPADGPALDCDEVCKAIEGCVPESEEGCQGGCAMTANYFAAEPGAAIGKCIVDAPCGSYEDGGALFQQCAGEYTIDKGDTDACLAVAGAIAACPDAEAGEFLGACNSMSHLFTADSNAKLAECADVSCGDIHPCLLKNNCLFGTFLNNGEEEGGGGSQP